MLDSVSLNHTGLCITASQTKQVTMIDVTNSQAVHGSGNKTLAQQKSASMKLEYAMNILDIGSSEENTT